MYLTTKIRTYLTKQCQLFQFLNATKCVVQDFHGRGQKFCVRKLCPPLQQILDPPLSLTIASPLSAHHDHMVMREVVTQQIASADNGKGLNKDVRFGSKMVVKGIFTAQQ